MWVPGFAEALDLSQGPGPSLFSLERWWEREETGTPMVLLLLWRGGSGPEQVLPVSGEPSTSQLP